MSGASGGASPKSDSSSDSSELEEDNDDDDEEDWCFTRSIAASSIGFLRLTIVSPFLGLVAVNPLSVTED